MYMRNSNHTIEKTLLGVISKMSCSYKEIPLNKKIIESYLIELMDYFNENCSYFGVLLTYSTIFEYQNYKRLLIDLVSKYQLGKYIPINEKIVLDISEKQRKFLDKTTRSISKHVDNCYNIITKPLYDSFIIDMVSEYDEYNNKISYLSKQIVNPIYSKSSYEELNSLVERYYTIKVESRNCSDEPRDKNILFNNKFRNDKKILNAIANNIVYGYTDLFLGHYYWSEELMRHYVEEASKKVEVGPVLVKKNK